ncbi:6-phosphogluconolactonase [Algoriphagus namhaensis]|uniref:6-phosphogluconolactonase n=1 Tax=Algoriphagus namhaensis TaxID=915353 RepID=A0ABV8AWZ4_9BACT
MSALAAELMMKEVELRPDLLFCAASGGSPTGLYQHMVDRYKESPQVIEEMRVIKLDEWVGLPEGSRFTSEYDIQQKLLKPIQHRPDRYISFDELTLAPKDECDRIQDELEKSGPIDVCILGIGVNGHLALNEPGEFLQTYCHVAELTESTLSHGMIQEVGIPLSHGMTLGMGNIFESKKIILLITGKGKKEIVEKFLTQQVTNTLPASLLWLHPNAEVILDNEVLGEL